MRVRSCHSLARFSFFAAACRVCCCACVLKIGIQIEWRAWELVRWQCCYCSPKLAVESWDGYCHWIKYQHRRTACLFARFTSSSTIDDSKKKENKYQHNHIGQREKCGGKKKEWNIEYRRWSVLCFHFVVTRLRCVSPPPHSNLIYIQPNKQRSTWSYRYYYWSEQNIIIIWRNN